MASAEPNQQSSSQITNLQNRECNIQDQQSFLEIFTQENEKNVKQKLNDEWIIQTTQSKLKEVETVQEAQKATIQEFQMKNKQLELKIREELEMRTVVMDKMTKIQKAMSLYVELYNVIKNNFKSCETTKTKLNNLYDSLLQDNAEAKRYNAVMTKKYDDHINELTTRIAKMKERFTKAVHENAQLDLKNEEALHKMTQTINMLEERLAELTQKNTNLLSELSEAISQKESLINDFTKLQGNHESLQAQLNENTAEYNTNVANLNRLIEDNKQSYEKLEAEHNSLLAAFDHQNDRMNEILSKNNTLENSVSEFEQSNAGLRNTIEELEKRIESERSKYSDELQLLKEKLMSREDEYAELNAQHLQTKQEGSLDQEKMVQLESKLSDVNIEIEMLKETIVTCKTENDRLRKDYEETDSLLKSKTGEMEEHIKKCRELESALETQEQRFTEQINTLQMYNTKLESEVQEKEKRTANDREMQQVKIRSLQGEIEMIKEKNQEKLNEMEAKSEITVNQMKDQTEFYKSEIDKIRNAERSKHMKEIESLNDRLRLVEFQKSELATSKQYLQAELEKKLFDNVQPPTQKKAIQNPPPSQANRAQKATSNLPRTFRAWDDSDSDSSCDRKITDLKRRTTDNFRIIPSKRPSSPSSASEQGSSPKQGKVNIISQERLDILFDTLDDKNFREPAEKKSLRSRKPHSRKPVI